MKLPEKFEERVKVRQSIHRFVSEELLKKNMVVGYYCKKCERMHRRGTKVFGKHWKHHAGMTIG